MNKKIARILLSAAVLVALTSISFDTFTYSTGPPDGMTGAPGEDNCTSCHGGSPITNGSVWDNISLTAIPYPGSSTDYKITITASEAMRTRYGFEVCVLPEDADDFSPSVGSFSTNSSPYVQVVNGIREYVEHTFDGADFSGTGIAEWEFDWIKPQNYSGNVVFYLAVNITNNDNSNFGDDIYLKTFSVHVLPVKWLNVQASAAKGGAVINWSVASEVNNSHFVIERSYDMQAWVATGKVLGQGNSSVTKHYSYIDQDVRNLGYRKIYYRVRQIDFDGNTSASKVVSLDFSPHQSSWSVYPNPATSILNISAVNQEEIVAVAIYDLQGKQIKTIDFPLPQYHYRLNTEDLSKGVYLMNIKTAKGQSLHKFIKS